ncbi:MAG: EAL domain-containing protein [Candidatus Competibacteraceae bacterium]|nr:EAL domain-containing protein [Candidatus Competibacteraceae bacterium]
MSAIAVEEVDGRSAQFRHRRADGEYLWLEAVGNPLFDARGRVCGAVISSRDITERKRVEAELRLAARVFENSREAIMITDAENRILSVNRAFIDITGYAAEEVIGQTPQLLASGRHDRDFFQALWHAVVTEGHWQGEVWNRRKNGEVYPEWLGITAVYDSRGQLTHYVGIFSDLSERKATADKIEFLAHHDPLTALPNRVLFYDRLEQALTQAERQRTAVALLILDLDRFKLVNDSLGHELGDQLLQMVAMRLHQHVRETDTVSRQGSDEFLILLPETGVEGTDRVVDNLLRCFQNEPFKVADHVLNITASIGVTLYPTHGRNSDSLLKQAGIALDYAKNGGGNTYRFFTASMNVNTLERLHLETSLRLALERGEFVLYYQPQFSMASGLIGGAEALLRWQHPEWGLVAPGRFIPVAEDSGLIVPIGEWVLREACRQARGWQEAGLRPITVAVNLSALQFKRSDLLATVTQALAESGLEPGYLELELTESILIQDVDSALKVVQQMRSMGLKLSIDDFGTGYSSLSYLQKLAVHKLKIDQSFIRGLAGNDTDSAAIIRAIIQMAHSLKLLTVAEGVESGQQLSFLRHHRCDEIQGYYLGRPMPAVEFATWLAEPAHLALA